MPNNYNSGKIYTIRCKTDDSKIYIGSTIQPLSHRWGSHKKDAFKHPNTLLYQSINNDWNNWYIELYEDYKCENKEQLHKREGEVIRQIGTLNKNIAGRTQQEWHQENDKKYYQKNKQHILEQKKEYYDKNRDKKLKYNKVTFINILNFTNKYNSTFNT